MTILTVNLDGISDKIARGADLTGSADGKRMIVSFWFALNGTSGFFWKAVGSQTNSINFERRSNNKWRVELRNAATQQILIVDSNDTFTNDNIWKHFLFSCDLGLGMGISHLYIEDANQKDESINNDELIDYTVPNHFVGGDLNDVNWDGCLAEVYLNYAEYLDFSIVANRRKFISADLKAVPNLGSIPTGTDPIGYFKGAAAAFEINSGTGGDYSQIDGPFSNCVDAPPEASGGPDPVPEDLDVFVDMTP